jgi:cytochrome P450
MMASMTHAALGVPTSRFAHASPSHRSSGPGARGVLVTARAVEEPKKRPYRGALFPGVELPLVGEETWRAVSRIFPWGNGAMVTEKVLGDLLKESVRAAPLFIPLFDYYKEYGGVYNLGAGPKWFVVVSDPTAVRTMFSTKADSFSKGILTDIMQPIMGNGLIPASKEQWAKRRPTVGAGFHGAWLRNMTKLFGASATRLADKLEAEYAAPVGSDMKQGKTVNAEDQLYAMALDIIGKAVFNYEFGALTEETPLIKAVYRVLRESEHRSTFPLQYWNIPGAMQVVPRQKQFQQDIDAINAELTVLIAEALQDKNPTDIADFESRNYDLVNDASLLRFLVDVRGDDVTGEQLRDDLMTMLIAGHETTAAVLTWTMFLLAKHPEEMRAAAAEVDAVVADPGGAPTVEEIRGLKKTRAVLAESMRLYPAPPILIRRALEDVTLPEGGMGKEITLKAGTDCFIAVWNLHRSPEYWENPDAFDPSRWQRRFENPNIKGWNGYDPNLYTGLYPNEQSTDFAYVPFGGGQRRCAGDMFAMMEATASLAVLLKRFTWELDPDAPEVEMITGATIHTKNGMPLKLRKR